MAAGAFLAAAAIGGVVGWTELAQRYKDRPTGPLRTAPGFIYILVNALASMGALAFIRYLELPSGQGLPQAVAQILLAGAAAMAFFRSAFFTMRVGETDLPLGPALLLQVILNAADRSYDRQRAAERSAAVTRIMKGVSFERAKGSLSAYCLKLMQNVTEEEAKWLGEAIEELYNDKSMGPRSKSHNLGLLLLTLVGESTLETAVKDLGGLILMPNDADLRLLGEAKAIAPADARRLLFLCRFLHPEAKQDGVEQELADILAATDPDPVKVLALLAALRRAFGSDVLEAALRKRAEAG